LEENQLCATSNDRHERGCLDRSASESTQENSCAHFAYEKGRPFSGWAVNRPAPRNASALSDPPLSLSDLEDGAFGGSG
jgi:hypothetical protein